MSTSVNSEPSDFTSNEGTPASKDTQIFLREPQVAYFYEEESDEIFQSIISNPQLFSKSKIVLIKVTPKVTYHFASLGLYVKSQSFIVRYDVIVNGEPRIGYRQILPKGSDKDSIDKMVKYVFQNYIFTV